MKLIEKKTWHDYCRTKILPPEKLAEVSASAKREGRVISTLNGTFDLLHAGHLFSIYEAHRLGDLLIMLLNSDASVKKYKSPDRPIIPLEYRLQLVASLEYVDYVSWFDETDPREALSKIQPDIHVNDSEYREHCIEEEIVKKYGGKVHFIDKISGLSTSEIIKKIRQCGS